MYFFERTIRNQFEFGDFEKNEEVHEDFVLNRKYYSNFRNKLPNFIPCQGNSEMHKDDIYFPIVGKITGTISKSKNKSYAVHERKQREKGKSRLIQTGGKFSHL